MWSMFGESWKIECLEFYEKGKKRNGNECFLLYHWRCLLPVHKITICSFFGPFQKEKVMYSLQSTNSVRVQLVDIVIIDSIMCLHTQIQVSPFHQCCNKAECNEENVQKLINV